MATKARGGFGTKLYRGRGDSGPETFDLVQECGDIQFPRLTPDTVEVTNQDSPGGFHEFVPTGTVAAGDVGVSFNFIQGDAVQQSLMADAATKTVRNFRIVLPSGTMRWSFAAIVKAEEAGGPIKEAMKRSVTLQITGQPVYEAHP